MTKTKGLTFHIVGMSPGMYICRIGCIHCLFYLVLYIVSTRVCDVVRHDVCLGSMHGWCIHAPIGN